MIKQEDAGAALRLSAMAYACVTAGSVAGMILSTYAIYLAQGGDPFLPTISNTWDHAPGTYISRWVLGNACVLFYAIQIMLYYTSKDTLGWRGLALGLGIGAVFCLSWVGAICDSTNPDCRGDDRVHSIFAVTFFVLYDVMMIIVSARERSRLLAVAVASAASTAARVAPLLVPCLATRDWYLAVFEWANVALVCGWSVAQVRTNCGGAGWYLGSRAGAPANIAWGLSGAACSKICCVLYVGTLAASAVLGLALGYLPIKRGVLFFISDMWTTPPGNWLSRWAIILGTHFGCVAHVSFYMATPEACTLRRGGLAVAIAAMFGLSVVGVCDESENFPLHVFGALLYFGGYDTFILCTLLGDRLQRRPADDDRARAWHDLRDVVGVVALVLGLWRLSAGLLRGTIFQSLPALAEWADALLIISFMQMDALFVHPACEDVVDAVTVAPATSLGEPLLQAP